MREGKQKLARQEAAVARTKRMQEPGIRGAAETARIRSQCYGRNSSTSTMLTATAVCLSWRSSSTPKASFGIVVPQGALFRALSDAGKESSRPCAGEFEFTPAESCLVT